MVGKEFIQMRRDRLTFAMMLGIPIIQLVLFGYAINTDPKHLPTAIVVADSGPFVRSLIAGLENTDYFRIVRHADKEEEGERLITTGQVQFVVNIPSDFSRKLVRGETPAVLVTADATDPVATGNALAALPLLAQHVLRHDLKGMVAGEGSPPPFEFIVHRRYNPEGITQYNIVPALMGVILTMTLVLITAVAITREHERGTMEYLLVTPVRPLEVMAGKIVPYIVVGYIQVSLILLAAKFLFDVPLAGSLTLLYAVMLIFIAANLGMGITFSTIARNQLQAVQMSFFFFLPSILLSGFMFPFRAMPVWAQWLGELLPLTHFLRLVRGILLKGNGVAEVAGFIWPIALFLLVVMSIAMMRFRRTLD